MELVDPEVLLCTPQGCLGSGSGTGRYRLYAYLNIYHEVPPPSEPSADLEVWI